MGDGLIPDPKKVLFEDENVRVSIVDPAKYMRLETVKTVEVTAEQLAHWQGEEEHPALQQEIEVKLTAHQWAGVLAMLRITMGVSPEPGLLRLMHDDIYRQIPIRGKDADDDA